MSLEVTEIKDPATNKPIAVSTTARLMYRKAYPNDYGNMRNARLNEIIAKDFAANSGKILHYFRLGAKKKSQTEHKPLGAEPNKIYAGVAEIRGSASFYFIAARKDDGINILTIQASWLKPKYRGSESNPIALGDS